MSSALNNLLLRKISDSDKEKYQKRFNNISNKSEILKVYTHDSKIIVNVHLFHSLA